jgi:hypothetical protein
MSALKVPEVKGQAVAADIGGGTEGARRNTDPETLRTHEHIVRRTSGDVEFAPARVRPAQWGWKTPICRKRLSCGWRSLLLRCASGEEVL